MAALTGGTEVSIYKVRHGVVYDPLVYPGTNHKNKIKEKSMDQRNAETKMGKYFNMEDACQSEGGKMCFTEINICLIQPLGFCSCSITAVCPKY